jgi:hypothetical protein
MKKIILSTTILLNIISLNSCNNSSTSPNVEIENQLQSNAGKAIAELKKADSLEANTLRLVKKSENPINNRALIKLFDISLASLGPDFANDYNPSVKPQYSIEGKQYYSIGSENYLLAAIGITNPNDCHLCTGELIIGLFQYRDKKWNKVTILESSVLSGWGNFGGVGKFELFGEKNVCVRLGGGFTQGGNTDTDEEIVGVIDNTLSIIYEGPTGFSSIDDVSKNENTITSFVNTGKKYYELKEVKLENDRVVKIKIKVFNEKKMKYE